MTDVAVPASFISLLDNFSTKFDQAEAADVIHQLKRLHPTRDSFDQTDLNGALKQLYVLGEIDEHGDQKVLKILAEKTSKKEEIIELLNDNKKFSSPPRKEDFVGRDNDVNNIIKLVTDHRGVNVFGDSGLGKTTLVKEVSKKLAEKYQFEPLIIDLRGTKETNAVYYKVLETFKLTPWDYSKERIYTNLQKLTDKTLLFLDNVEQFLSSENEVDEKRRKTVLEFLRTIMSSEASQRGSLKVILTSRIQIKDSMLEDVAFKEYELQPLAKTASRQLMSWRIKDETDVEQVKARTKIVNLCRNTPYLLERAEQLLRQNYSKPSEVLEKLNALKNKGVPEQFACISALFDSLPSDPMKQVALKISLLQRPFSVSTAMKISEISSDYDAELDLEMLATYKIITAENVNGERKYDLHTLFREFVTSYLCKDPVYKDAYERAENQFVEHFSKRFVQLAKNLDVDFVGTFKELEVDKANLELSIDLITRKEKLDLILQSDDVKETGSIAVLFVAFMNIKERRKLFGNWAKIVEKKDSTESWLSSANFRCWESIQLADMEGTQNACEALKKAEASLAKAMLLLTPEQVKAARGLCKYCSGQIKRMTSENLIDESSKTEKERLLEQALFDLKESLAIHRKVYGDHTLTARTLNHIGNCYMECGKPKDALTFYQRAMEMKIKLVGSEKHFDIPTYYNQLSQAYEALGNQGTSSETSWSFQSIASRILSLISREKRNKYEEAVCYLEKALSLQEELGVNDTDDTATFQRNLANILIGLGEYDQALEYAKKSSKIRKANLGEHPETVRILYLTGIINEWRKDHKAALQSYEEAFVMEESLPEDNHSIVRNLLCERLEVMCKKLNKKDKLKEYRPRMDRILKDTAAIVGKKTGAAGKETDADDGEGTVVIRLDDKGGYYDFSNDYFFLQVPPNAVKMPVKVKYRVDSCCQPPMAGITTSVSYFLEMSSSLTEELSEPITVTLMHSGPGKEYGYKTTVMAFDQHKYVWEELKGLAFEQVSNLGRIKKDFIQVQVSKLTILAVVTRLIADRFQVTPKGCVVRSSVCDDVTIEFPEGAVDKTVQGTMKLLLMVQRNYLENEYGYSCPIILVDGFESDSLQKPVTITIPHPCPVKFPMEKFKLMRLPNKPENVSENNWEEIKDTIIYKEMKKDQKYFVQLQVHVQHFSWMFLYSALMPLTKLQDVFKKLISSPPMFVRFGLFKAKDGPPVKKLKAFKATLTCAANRNERYIKEMEETYERLAIETSKKPMQPNDEAVVKVEGGFQEKVHGNVQGKTVIVFIKDEKSDKELNVCRKNENDRNENDSSRELEISLYKELESDDNVLCTLFTCETEGIEIRPDQTDNAYKMTSYPRGVAVIVNIEYFTIEDPEDPMFGKLPDRVGSQMDQENIVRLFQQYLGFMVEEINKTSGSELFKEIRRIAREYDFSTSDCFVFCIMSHGAKNCIYASDGERLTPSLIVSPFRSSKCKSLAGKPKLFFFQGCRGESEDLGVPLRDAPEDGMERATLESNDGHNIPETADILEFYSCYEGFNSYRYPESGSPFIQSIVEVFSEYACSHHILDLITMVMKRESESQHSGKKQMPQSKSTLTKNLYFWPGINCKDEQ